MNEDAIAVFWMWDDNMAADDDGSWGDRCRRYRYGASPALAKWLVEWRAHVCWKEEVYGDRREPKITPNVQVQ